MTQDITQRTTGTSVAMPEPKNPFEAYGDSGGTRILGDMLKFSKGEWVYGRDNLEMPVDIKLLAGAHLIEVGWICWLQGKPSDVAMGRIGEGFVIPRRAELGMTNSLEWPRSEQDSDYGKPRDPWQHASGMPLVGSNGHLYTFVTGSKGGEAALKALAKTYGKRVRQHPEEIPVVVLAMGSYRHPNKQLGKIWTPEFKIVGWSPARRLDAAIAKAEVEAHEEREEELQELGQQGNAPPPKKPKPGDPAADYQAERPSRRKAKPEPAQTYAGEGDDIPF